MVEWVPTFASAMGAVAAAIITAAVAVYIHRRTIATMPSAARELAVLRDELTRAHRETERYRHQCEECGKLLTSSRLEIMRLRAGFK